MKYLENINKLDYLFLTDIYEPDENELLLQVKGSVVADEETEVFITAEKTIRANAISIDKSAPYFEIYFENYVAYHVLNESFAVSDPDDQFEKVGLCRFRVFDRSEYMDYILKTTFADQVFPGEMKHYGIYTQNHIIHVISFKDPVIEMKTFA